MIYVSIDIETSGMNEDTCQVWEFAAVIEDTAKDILLTDLPKFHTIVTQDVYQGEIFAMNMHADLLKMHANDEYRISKGVDKCHNKDLASRFWSFIYKYFPQAFEQFRINGKETAINIAGKNFNGFDRNFLKKVPHMMASSGFGYGYRFHHRVIDPAPLYVRPEDENLPGLETCLERAGYAGDVKHGAYSDALDVIKVIRASGKFNNE